MRDDRSDKLCTKKDFGQMLDGHTAEYTLN